MKIKGILYHRRLFRIFFWLWLILVFTFSSLPGLPVPEKKIFESFRSDYLIHFFQYFVLAIFYVCSLKKAEFSLKKFFLICLTGLIIGIIDELHQIWIPGRSFNPVDMILNSAGFLFGNLMSYYLMLIIFPSGKRE